MHTIGSLRKTLDLATTNQVRNRIDAIKDVLTDSLRRGPNNQILLTDEGVGILRRLQELYDSGLTMKEASEVIRATAQYQPLPASSASPGIVSNPAIPRESGRIEATLREEIAFLRERVAFLEAQLRGADTVETPESAAWWTRLREDVDAA
ncbi:MAG: hypothetical protein WBC63_01470 [Candidatus Bipolaricaulia bacterium]